MPKAFPWQGCSAPPVPSAVLWPPCTSPLCPAAYSEPAHPAISWFQSSLLCGSLWASIYRKTHKCRSHFLSPLLGFLLSQNRPVTPTHDLVSSLAKTSLHSQLPISFPHPTPSPPAPKGLISAPHRMEGPVKYT